jgi:hypothetical protein
MGGLATFTEALAGGASLAGVRVDLAQSGEAQADVTTLLQWDFAATPDAAAVAAGQLQLADGLSFAALAAQTLLLGTAPAFVAGSGGTVVAAPSIPHSSPRFLSWIFNTLIGAAK